MTHVEFRFATLLSSGSHRHPAFSVFEIDDRNDLWLLPRVVGVRYIIRMAIKLIDRVLRNLGRAVAGYLKMFGERLNSSRLFDRDDLS